MYASLDSLFMSMYRDFGTKISQAKATYSSGRAERNPIIKQTINKKNNFKTFIISQKVLLDLYDILTFIDSQYYIAGLLRFPPNRVNGDLAKMRFLITRLGLQSNPVFIINQMDQSVILSSPDVLSLTGTPVFSRITRDQMKAICFIDYQKDLWNSDKIMSHYFTEKINKTLETDQSTVKALNKEIIDLSKNKNMTDAQRKFLQNKINVKNKLDEKIFNNSEKTNKQNGLNLSTTIKSEFKPGYAPSQNNQNGFNPPQREYQPQQFNRPVQPQGSGYNPTSGNQPQPTQQSGHMYPGFAPKQSPWNNPYRR